MEESLSFIKKENLLEIWSSIVKRLLSYPASVSLVMAVLSQRNGLTSTVSSDDLVENIVFEIASKTTL